MTNEERITYVKDIAGVILSQLCANRMELMAWGSEEFICLDKEVNGYQMPTLSFKIRTPKVPKGGHVQISLNEGEDLYVVEAIQIEQGHIKSLGIVEQVYAEDLHYIINGLIEDKETMTQAIF